MGSWLADTIQQMGTKSFTQLLNVLLIRIPILVVGNDERRTNQFIMNLAQLVPHRQRVMFWNDFVSPEEAEQLFQNERYSTENRRAIILCTTNVFVQALNKIPDYFAWVLGVVPKSKEELVSILDHFNQRTPSYFVVYLLDKEPTVQVHGSDPFTTGFKFEKRIINKILQETNMSITRLSRLISKKVNKDKLSRDLRENLLSFDQETAMIQQDVYEKELSEFIHASRRALALLTRIKLVQQFGLPARIDGQTLLDTIDYHKVNASKLIRFISAEYGEDLSSCVGSGRMSRVGDWIDGMWGVSE